MLRKAMWKIQNEHKTLQPNSYWFSPETMRFFKCRLPDFGYLLGDDYYFITSEKCPQGLKLSSIRKMDSKGNIETIGDFHSLTRTQARRILAHDILKVKVKDL